MICQPWLCKTLTALLQYTLMSNFAWMLVEGIYLHNRLAVCVFRSDAPFKIFYFIGWGKYTENFVTKFVNVLTEWLSVCWSYVFVYHGGLTEAFDNRSCKYLQIELMGWCCLSIP